MTLPALVRPVVRGVNAAMVAATRLPLLGPLLRRGITEITYVGRRSGRTFRTPVGYRRDGDEVSIIVLMPDRKTWWRNFLAAGGPIAVHLDGVDRPGHAVARRDERGRVTVTVRLDPEG